MLTPCCRAPRSRWLMHRTAAGCRSCRWVVLDTLGLVNSSYQLHP
jgi:hypothetical protein